MKQSKSGHFSFQLYSDKQRSRNKREGEIKLAEKIHFGEASTSAKYVILGISEDIGPQMNGGNPGSNLGFDSFVKALQTVQSNSFLDGAQLGILGEIVQNSPFSSIDQSKGWVEELDAFVEQIVHSFVDSEQHLIVIGGGHNNALPLLRWAKKSQKREVHAVNVDPHADCRTAAFRHSGNSFSIGLDEGTIERYSVFGLHESYNNTHILNYLRERKCDFNTFESYLDDSSKWWENWQKFIHQLPKNSNLSLDIDLDAIAFLPSSALTPSGFTIEEIRKIIRSLASQKKIRLFHLPEGAPTSEVEQRLYGKMLSYFVCDFVKAQESLSY